MAYLVRELNKIIIYTMQTFKSIMVAILICLVLCAIGWSVWNSQRCTKMDIPPNATCEQIAENSVKNCKYVVHFWNKVDYNKELQNCIKLKEKYK